jgi:hypothetical protein
MLREMAFVYRAVRTVREALSAEGGALNPLHRMVDKKVRRARMAAPAGL